MTFIRPNTVAHAYYDLPAGTIDLRFFRNQQGHGPTIRMIGKPLEYHEATSGEYNQPSVRLKPDEAQELMDSLWDAGVRPMQGAGSTGQLQAVEKHLNDFRAIVFKNMGIPVGVVE